MAPGAGRAKQALEWLAFGPDAHITHQVNNLLIGPNSRKNYLLDTNSGPGGSR